MGRELVPRVPSPKLIPKGDGDVGVPWDAHVRLEAPRARRILSVLLEARGSLGGVHVYLHLRSELLQLERVAARDMAVRGPGSGLALPLAKVSFLRRKTNNTQAPGLDTPRCVTLGGLYTAAERIQPAEQEQRPGEGVRVRCGVLARRGRGRRVTSEEARLDRPASELADCGRPHASRGAALLELGGPLRGRGGGWGDRDCRYGSISV